MFQKFVGVTEVFFHFFNPSFCLSVELILYKVIVMRIILVTKRCCQKSYLAAFNLAERHEYSAVFLSHKFRSFELQISF